MDAVLKPLAGQAIVLFILQLSVLLTVARLGSERVKRLGLPSVIGELAAGILVGPTFFGHFFPHAFRALFPPDAAVSPARNHVLVRHDSAAVAHRNRNRPAVAQEPRALGVHRVPLRNGRSVLAEGGLERGCSLRIDTRVRH